MTDILHLTIRLELHHASADLIVTLGAGSLTDGAKVASFVGIMCLATVIRGFILTLIRP